MKKRLLVTGLIVVLCFMATLAWAGATRIEELPYTIYNPGPYRVEGNLSSNSSGIIVNADNVTIDLQGYVLTGNGTTGTYGINLDGHDNVLVKNGTITNFGNGIQSGGGEISRIINVSSIDNLNYGLLLTGNNHLVKDCVIAGNGDDALSIDDGGIISGNLIYNNTDGAIEGSGGWLVIGNSIMNNGGDGIDADRGSAIIGNAVYQNGTGIEVRDGSSLQSNAVSYNQLDGIKAYQTGTYTASGNAAFGNNTSGGEYVNMTQDANSVLGENVSP